MKMNVEKFLKTELGCEIVQCVDALDFYLRNGKLHRDDIKILFAQWDAYKLALQHFYKIEYFFTRTDEYYGICTENEEFLYKKER